MRIVSRQRVLWIAVVTLLALIAAVPVTAATLADYRSRLEAARLDAIAIRRYDEDRTSYAASIQQKTDAISATVPLSETVVTPFGEVKTDNQWLKDSLSAYQAEADPDKRQTILLSIDERLAAIENETAAIGENEATSTKDENKQKLAEILRRPEYQKLETQEPTLLRKWLDALEEWLEDTFPSPHITSSVSGWGSGLKLGLQIAIFALVIGSVIFLFYKFSSLLGKRKGTVRGGQDRIVLGERVTSLQSSRSLFSEAESLAQRGEIRAAIRKGYIALLCELADRKFVRLAGNKTNKDYVRDVQKRESLFKNLTLMTRRYEVNWYGLRQSDISDWHVFREGYATALKDLDGET